MDKGEVKSILDEMNELNRGLDRLKNSSLSRQEVFQFVGHVDKFLSYLKESLEETTMVERKTLLTKREHEIAIHLSNGFRNHEIASALRISIKTIEFHVKSILQKTETANRTEAISYLIKNKHLND